MRRRWAAAVGLMACLLLHLVAPGLAQGGRAAEAAAVTAAVDAVEPGAASGTEAERAGEPCPCGEEPSVRRAAARTPRAAGAARAGAVVTGAPVLDRGGTDVRAVRTGRRPGTVVPPNAVELQTFRC